MSTSKAQQIEFSDGYTLLMLKAEEGNIDEVKKILSNKAGLDVNAINKNGYTALALAVKNGYTDIVAHLIDTNADVNIKNNSGQSPLFLACWNNYESIVRLLLENGADINCLDQRAWTPLMIASYHGHRDVVKTLLEYDADINIQDCFGKRAINRAKDVLVIKMLQLAEDQVNDPANKRKKAQGILKQSASNNNLIRQNGSFTNLPSSLKKTSSRGNIMPATLVNNNYETKKNLSPLKELRFASDTKMPLSCASTRNGSESKLQKSQTKNKAKSPIRNPDLNYSSLSHKNNTTPHLNNSFNTFRQSSRVQSPAGQNSLTKSLSRLRTPSPSKQRHEAFKESLQCLITEELALYSKKMQMLILQKVAYEVPLQTQSCENKIKHELNSILNIRVNHIANSLLTYFNLKLKFCLNKLGYDTNALDIKPFLETDDKFDFGMGNAFEIDKSNIMGSDPRDLQVMANEIKNLEQSMYNHKIQMPQQADNQPSSNTKRSRNVTPEKYCEHHFSSYHYQSQAKTEVIEYITQEMKSSTRGLIEYSQNKIAENLKESSNRLESKLVKDLNNVIDHFEELFKTKFESLINYKTSQLMESLSHPQKVSPYKKPGLNESLSATSSLMGSSAKRETKPLNLSSPTRISTQKMKMQNELEQLQDDYTYNATLTNSIKDKDKDKEIRSRNASTTRVNYQNNPNKESNINAQSTTPFTTFDLQSSNGANQMGEQASFNEGGYQQKNKFNGGGTTRQVDGTSAREKINLLKNSLNSFLDEQDPSIKSSLYREERNNSAYNPISIQGEYTENDYLTYSKNDSNRQPLEENQKELNMPSSLSDTKNNNMKSSMSTDKVKNNLKLEELKQFYKNKVINKQENNNKNSIKSSIDSKGQKIPCHRIDAFGYSPGTKGDYNFA